MTQIAVLTNDTRLMDLVRGSGLAAARIDKAAFEALSRAKQAPAALVVDVRVDHQLPAGLVVFRKQHPDAGVVVVASSLEPRFMLDAMRAGVNECVTEPLTAAGMDEAVRRVMVGAHAEPTGLVFAFVGAKGGVGTTTVAANTAAALARVGHTASLLIDLHVADGDSSLYFGAEPRFSVADALENVHKVDESFFAGLVEKTKAGVHLLAPPARAEYRAIDPQRTRTLLDFARRKYRFTVLDVPRSDPAMLDALDPATSIVVVTSQNLSALRGASRVVEALRHRYGAPRVAVLVNRFEQSSLIGDAEVERATHAAARHVIPSDYRGAVDALNHGRPVVLEKDSKLARAFMSFARQIAGVPKEQPARAATVFARLAWRRA